MVWHLCNTYIPVLICAGCADTCHDIWHLSICIMYVGMQCFSVCMHTCMYMNVWRVFRCPDNHKTSRHLLWAVCIYVSIYACIGTYLCMYNNNVILSNISVWQDICQDSIQTLFKYQDLHLDTCQTSRHPSTQLSDIHPDAFWTSGQPSWWCPSLDSIQMLILCPVDWHLWGIKGLTEHLANNHNAHKTFRNLSRCLQAQKSVRILVRLPDSVWMLIGHLDTCKDSCWTSRQLFGCLSNIWKSILMLTGHLDTCSNVLCMSILSSGHMLGIRTISWHLLDIWTPHQMFVRYLDNCRDACQISIQMLVGCPDNHPDTCWMSRHPSRCPDIHPDACLCMDSIWILIGYPSTYLNTWWMTGSIHTIFRCPDMSRQIKMLTIH